MVASDSGIECTSRSRTGKTSVNVDYCLREPNHDLPTITQPATDLDPIPNHPINFTATQSVSRNCDVKMPSKQKRPIGDANEEMGLNKRAKKDAELPAKNMDSSTTSSLRASFQFSPIPTSPEIPAAVDAWHLGETRRAIFAKIHTLGGGGAVNIQQNVVSENLARRRVYEDMYAQGYSSGNGAAITVNIEYSVDARLWADHGMTFRCPAWFHVLTFLRQSRAVPRRSSPGSSQRSFRKTRDTPTLSNQSLMRASGQLSSLTMTTPDKSSAREPWPRTR